MYNNCGIENWVCLPFQAHWDQFYSVTSAFSLKSKTFFWGIFEKIIANMTSKNLVLCWVKFLNICLHLIIIDQQIILLFVWNWKITSLVLSSAFFYNNKWSNIILILVFRLKPRKNHSLKTQSVPIVRSPFGDC